MRTFKSGTLMASDWPVFFNLCAKSDGGRSSRPVRKDGYNRSLMLAASIVRATANKTQAMSASATII